VCPPGAALPAALHQVGRAFFAKPVQVLRKMVARAGARGIGQKRRAQDVHLHEGDANLIDDVIRRAGWSRATEEATKRCGDGNV
jgi:hypothetical protein